MVSIGLLAVLVGLAAPSMAGALRDYRAAAALEDLANTIELARIEAQRRAIPVRLERRTACGVALASDGDWSCGYRLYADNDRDGTLGGTEPVIRVIDVATGSTVTHASGGTTQVAFNAQGRATAGAQRFVVRAVGVGRRAGTVCVNATGLIRVLTGDATCP